MKSADALLLLTLMTLFNSSLRYLQSSENFFYLQFGNWSLLQGQQSLKNRHLLTEAFRLKPLFIRNSACFIITFQRKSPALSDHVQNLVKLTCPN